MVQVLPGNNYTIGQARKQLEDAEDKVNELTLVQLDGDPPTKEHNYRTKESAAITSKPSLGRPVENKRIEAHSITCVRW